MVRPAIRARYPAKWENRFTYASPEDSWFKRQVIMTVEHLTGRKTIQRMYDLLMANDPNPIDVWKQGLDIMNISMDYNEEALEQIPKTGPLIFVANHPFGVVDGAVLLHLVTRVRKDFFILINEVISHHEFLKQHLLPIDFRGDEAALQTNLQTKANTTERLKNGEALVIFPSGAIATQLKFFGPVEELPWRGFISNRIHETQCTVLPIYFYGKNSALFQFVSKLSMNLRLGLLLHEIMNKRNKVVKARIGPPIPYSEMAALTEKKEMMNFLREKTLSLKDSSVL